MSVLMRILFVGFPVFFLSADFALKEDTNLNRQVSIPEPIVPVYTRLKNLHLTTNLAVDGKPAITIVAPAMYKKEGKSVSLAIKKLTGVRVPVVDESSPRASVPLKGNLILIGNRSTNRAISDLYDLGYTFLDLKYPGREGFVVRSLHNPFGDGRNVLFAGGSDLIGVRSAVKSLIKELQIISKEKERDELSVGYLCQIKLGKDYSLPENIRSAEIWEASETYGSSGYFGWNIVSKNMALYYMTGEEKYLKEFLRYSFPDETAIKEIEEFDGERIENKTDPLAGPYHYSAHMMILLWDLIEESPVLTDEDRLKVTNAFARQLPHRVVEGVYRRREPPASLGGRHGDWSAFSLYVLGRYFQKDYPDPIWQHCMQAADLFFSTLRHTYWMAGNNDHLFWFTSFYDPLINYLAFTGNRDPEMMRNLRLALNTQEILSTGLANDWGIRASSLSMLNKAAYILKDGRYLYYRERINLDTDVFRLGWSYWPEENFKSVIPVDQSDKWNIQWMPERMWKERSTGFPADQSFRWGSYRSEPGPEGDYVLIKGYNGAGRNPYHTYDILELRLNGTTLLKGYGNQVLTSADGMVEPKVALDGRLLYNSVTRNFVTAVAEVPGLPFVNWKRTLCLRKGKYTIIADDLGFRTKTKNLSAEITWEIQGAEWMPNDNYIKIQSGKDPQNNICELHSSDLYDVQNGRIITMKWVGSAKKGEHRIFFHLLGQKQVDADYGLSALRLSENAAFLSLPEPAFAVVGKYKSADGDLILLGKKFLYGQGISSAGIDQQLMLSDNLAELDWDFEHGTMTIICDRHAKLSLAITDPEIILNGKRVTGKAEQSLYSFSLNPGRHEISGARPSGIVRENLRKQLEVLPKQAQAFMMQEKAKNDRQSVVTLPRLNSVMHASLGVSPATSIIIPSQQGDMMCIASGNSIFMFDAAGNVIRKMITNNDIRVLNWWEETKLLLAGCVDEKVIAFDEQGKIKWEFTSVMDNAVYEAGKQYWFKSAHPGIYGLHSGVFDGGKSRAFVGSACTLEILDEEGNLVKRLPVFWGPGKQFLIVDAEDGSKNLLIGRWHNDRENFAIINSSSMKETGRGYSSVPSGHSYVGGWDCMNRYDNFLLDMNGDNKRELVSAINGTWNRITVYSEDGIPLYNAQFGPGLKEPRANLRMMDVGDLNRDGKYEIIVALSSGLVNALDYKTEKLWSTSFISHPRVVKVVSESGTGTPVWICVGCEDGKVYALDSQGNKIREDSVSGKPADLQIMHTANGAVAVITTESGEITGFSL